jgi:acyl-CoA synthetase (AMP-forming)/AMP-acid ligase II
VVRSVDRDRLATGDARKGDGAELVSVGRPLDGYAIEVRDPAGATLQEGRVGHIHVSGPSLMSGYMGGHPSPIADGWLDTGDLGVLLDGELHVTGRAKDVVVLRGRNHSPHSIEEACGRVPGVRPGCVVAVSVPSDGGERLLVLAERREDRPGLDEDCRRAVRAATGLTADQVVVLQAGALPRTSSGKLRRNEALRQLQAGELP